MHAKWVSVPRRGHRCHTVRVRDPIYHYRMTEYDTSILPNAILASEDDTGRGPDDWIPQTGLSIGHPGWGLLYHVILARLDPDIPSLVVETGTNIGSSSLVIAQAIADSGRDALLRTIEIDQDRSERASERIAQAGLTAHVELLVGDSLAMLPHALDGDRELAVAFLDGNHFHDHVVNEFELVLPRCSFDTVVVFDNTYLIAEHDEDPRVNGALRTIQARHGGNLINLPICSWYTPGISLWQRQPFHEMAPPTPDSFIRDKSG